MALASGRKLGSYEIGAPLGAGGMGEVYRARDFTEEGYRRDHRLPAVREVIGNGATLELRAMSSSITRKTEMDRA